MGKYSDEEKAILERSLPLPEMVSEEAMMWKLTPAGGRLDLGWFDWVGFEDATGARLAFTAITQRMATDMPSVAFIWSTAHKVGCLRLCRVGVASDLLPFCVSFCASFCLSVSLRGTSSAEPF